MKKGEFKVNGTSSLEYKTLIQQRPAIPSARRKTNLKQIPGVSGDYIFDEEAYDNVSFSLSLFTTGATEEEVSRNKYEITNLLNSGKYMEVEFYHDDQHIYELIVTDSIDFEPDGQTPLLLPMTIQVSAKPFKRVKNNETSSGSNLTITNPYYYVSKPEITLYGTGNMSLFVNDVEYPFKEIDDHVILDSEVQHAYKQLPTRIVNRNDKMMIMDFPTLKPGNNTLSLSGATSMTVKPRWVVKV